MAQSENSLNGVKLMVNTKTAWLRLELLATQAVESFHFAENNIDADNQNPPGILGEISAYIYDPTLLRKEIEHASRKDRDEAKYLRDAAKWIRVFGNDFCQFILVIVEEIGNIGYLSDSGYHYLLGEYADLVPDR